MHYLARPLFQNLIRTVGCLILILSLRQTPAFAIDAINTKESSSIQLSEASKRYISLEMTRQMYSVLITQYIIEGQEKYRPNFFLIKIYLTTFLNEWQTLIEQKPELKSTQEIWTHLSQGKLFLAKHFGIWKNLNYWVYNGSAKDLQLGYNRQTFMAQALKSENPQNPKEQATKLLGFLAPTLASASDAEAAFAIAKAFEKYPDSSLQKLAVESSRSIGGSENLEALGNILAALTGGAKSAPKALGYVAAKMPKTTGATLKILEIWKSNITRLAQSGKSFLQKPIHNGVSASVTIHAGVIASEKLSTPLPTPEKTEGVTPFLEVFEAYKELLSSSDKNNFENFQPQALPNWLLAQLEAMGRQSIASPSQKFDALTFLTVLEKHAGLWPEATAMSSDIFSNRIQQIKAQVAKIPAGNIEAFRKYILEGPLYQYRRDTRRLSAVFAGWGGNCVSQSLLITSLLMEFPELIPAGAKLGVFLSADHMESVLLLPNEQVYFLVSGKQTPKLPHYALFKPEALILQALQTAQLAKDLSTQNYVYQLPSGASTGSQAEKGIGQLWNELIHGIDNGLVGNLGAGIPGLQGTTIGEVPESAKMSYAAPLTAASFISYFSNTTAAPESSSLRSNLQPAKPLKVIFEGKTMYLVSSEEKPGDMTSCKVHPTSPRTSPETIFFTKECDSYLVIQSESYKKLKPILKETPTHLRMQAALYFYARQMAGSEVDLSNFAGLKEPNPLLALSDQNRFAIRWFNNLMKSLNSSNLHFIRNTKFIDPIATDPFGSYSPTRALLYLISTLTESTKSLDPSTISEAGLKLMKTSESLSRIASLIRESMRLMTEDPKQFVEKLADVDPEHQHEILSLAIRWREQQWVLEDFLQTLTLNNVTLVQTAAEKKDRAEVDVNLPNCSDCSGFYTFSKGTSAGKGSETAKGIAGDSTGNGNSGIKNASSRKYQLRLPHATLIQLSLFTGRGFQLWTADTWKEVDRLKPLLKELAQQRSSPNCVFPVPTRLSGKDVKLGYVATYNQINDRFRHAIGWTPNDRKDYCSNSILDTASETDSISRIVNKLAPTNADTTAGLSIKTRSLAPQKSSSQPPQRR